MDKINIFRKTIEKAIENDWDLYGQSGDVKAWTIASTVSGSVALVLHLDNAIKVYQFEEVIFNHEFAQAFWGENWALDLKSLAVSENRFVYLSIDLNIPF